MAGTTAEQDSSAQAAAASEAQAAEAAATAHAQAAGGEESQDDESNSETISLEEARKLRDENRKLRARAKDAESKLTTAATADDQALTELEKVTRERDDFKSRFERLNASLRAERANARAVELATKAGAIDAGAIARLIPADAVEFDDDGKPENVAELIAEAKKSYPALFRAAAGGGNGAAKDAEPEMASPVSLMARAYARKK